MTGRYLNLNDWTPICKERGTNPMKHANAETLIDLNNAGFLNEIRLVELKT